ncbi:Electron transport complex subunit RsxB [bioreactor metagenome]|jgi:Na+-translocating ferredoxin:NAD+ oxidoreductase RNF subunit RnfB|uniref:Electron transport complex subunit RsxB n=1 Tax=bioreactor metagenome TaxID=1076179 RepID=A0A644TZE9_9ZZZZ|nr:[Fe-Fe] hydrogenase large subunit C-terminal domain-containing protein [Lentimicrobium sp.]MEA5110101.1 [Fe-Fe] hydrogenase large subunit C-terminal domain-containing protein [Lentimicrobium sp.]
MKPPLINIDKAKCKVCYACVRACPVNAIQVRLNQEAPEVDHDRCIGCGSCLQVCAPQAITYRDSCEDVKKILTSEEKAVAIVAPSISGEFDDITDYRKFVRMIRELGFSYVNEASFGVDLVAAEYRELFTKFLGKYYIATNCPPIVALVEKFHPDLIGNLAPIISPMVASAQIARQLYGKNIKVVYIGPCIGAKDEALRFEGDAKVDAVLTFVELRQLFAEFNIKESTVEYSDFDPPLGYKGSLYAVSNGILQAAGLDEDLMQGNVITAEGKDNVLEAIREFESSIDFIRKHFNLFYCEGCLMGPGTSRGGKKYARKTLVTDYANKKLKNFDLKTWEKACKKHSGLTGFKAEFAVDDQRLPQPSEEKVEEILKVIGKQNSEDKLGCGACGYESCRDFAVNVAKGLTKTDMCITYSLKSKHDFIRTLKLTNEKLAKTQEALLESERKARQDQQAAQEALERTSSMLQKLPSAVVIVDENLKVIESNQSFINTLGEDAEEINEIIPGLVGADLKTLLPFQFYKLFSAVLTTNENVVNRDVHLGDRLLNVSVFSIKKGKIAGAVLRDMYLPEVRKEEVIHRVTEVIDENLDLVQKIAFLLGEGAAKTERMLNSIIESHKAGKK